MSIAAVEPGTTNADPGAAVVPPGAVAEVERNYNEAVGAEGDASEILSRLDAFESGDSETIESALDKDTRETIRKDDTAEAKADEAEDEDAKTIREINARSLARMKARTAARRPGPATPAATPAVAAATAASKAADAAADAKPATAATGAQPSNEVAQAVRDVLAQIEKLAGDDEAATAATASGTVDKGAEARAAELKTIRETVAKIADGLNETSALKTSIETLQQQLKDQATNDMVRRHISDQIDSIADALPLVASTKRHEVQVEQDGVKKTVRMTGAEIVHRQAIRFFNTYKAPPDLKELAKRIEKKLTGTTQEKNGEKTTATRKTVSTSHSSPPAARQGPDKRSGKEAENDFYKRLGLTDELRD